MLNVVYRGRGGPRRRPRALVLAAALIAAATGLTLTPHRAFASAPAFVQGTTLTTGSRVASTSANLTGAVAQGDLLVGWFSQYNAGGQVQVSDNVNGAWTRAPGSLAFQNDTGDIALYYRPNSVAAPSGLTVTVSAAAPAYYTGTIAEYSGVAVAGPLDQVASKRNVSTAVDTGPTAAVGAGELVFSASVTGGNPGSATPGSSQGIAYTRRAVNSSGSAMEADITSSAAGAQDGRATLGSSTDWYAVCAVFRAASTTDTQPPTVPTGLHATSIAASAVNLAWTASTDNVGVTGYTVYRNATAIATITGGTTTYTDTTVAPSTTYTYTVDAFDGAGNHSAQSPGLPVTTPATSPAFVQGISNSPGTRTTTTTLALSSPVGQGHLLVGWFAQYDSAGQVQVSDNVNGAWTRSLSEHFTNGGGDIALFYFQNTKAAPSGLVVTLSAASATYLPGAVSEYSGVATTGALDQAAVGSGRGTSADSGPTAAVPAGELIVGGLLIGQQPGAVSPGSSQGATFALTVHNGSGSADEETILSGAAGAQDGRFSFVTSNDWYAMCATFR